MTCREKEEDSVRRPFLLVGVRGLNPSIYGVMVVGLFFLVNFVLALLTGIIDGVEMWIYN